MNGTTIHVDLVTLELIVPVESVLLSSYSHWNEFMDYVLVPGRVPRNSKYARSMLKEPLLKHSVDDIQAVIPYIEPSWVQRIEKLVVKDRDWDEPLLDRRHRTLVGPDP
jgi:hypothetical protein